jgi:hypothetical protein
MEDSSQSIRGAPETRLEAANEAIYNAAQVIEAFLNRADLSIRVVDV